MQHLQKTIIKEFLLKRWMMLAI